MNKTIKNDVFDIEKNLRRNNSHEWTMFLGGAVIGAGAIMMLISIMVGNIIFIIIEASILPLTMWLLAKRSVEKRSIDRVVYAILDTQDKLIDNLKEQIAIHKELNDESKKKSSRKLEDRSLEELNHGIAKWHSITLACCGFMVANGIHIITNEIIDPVHSNMGHWALMLSSFAFIAYGIILGFRSTKKAMGIFGSDGRALDRIYEYMSEAEEKDGKTNK